MTRGKSLPLLLAAFVCGAAFLCGLATAAVQPLPARVQASLGRCNPNTFTISGISAGACMAVQFQYAWSSIIRGAGIVASAPYMCSSGMMVSGLAGAELCLNAASMENPNSFYALAELNAAAGTIDPLSNLKNQTIFLFSGWLDTVVPQTNMANVYSMLGMAGAGVRVTKFFNYSAEHAWITDKYGNSCSTLGSPYINNCGLDFAGEFLRTTFSDIDEPWNHTMGAVNLGNMFTFDQTQFGANSLLNSLADTGYMYVPTACQSNATVCHLHLNWHGCTQESSSLGELYVLQTEINEWAESNNIIVLYPQAATNALLENPNACFDWWGYAGSNYATKQGTQIAIFRQMIQHYGGF